MPLALYLTGGNISYGHFAIFINFGSFLFDQLKIHYTDVTTETQLNITEPILNFENKTYLRRDFVRFDR